MKNVITILTLCIALIFEISVACAEDRVEKAQFISEVNEVFTEFLSQLEKKRQRVDSDEAFLRHVFYKLHNKFLKSYQMHASVDDVLVRGWYDCVSGTALYALTLDHFNFDYNIHESAFHVNLSVVVDGKEIYFESTDALLGFVMTKEDIEELNRKIDVENLNEGFERKVIGLKELIGLQHLNLAINHFNQRDYKEASLAIEKAQYYYPSERIQSMAWIIATQLSPELSMVGSNN